MLNILPFWCIKQLTYAHREVPRTAHCSVTLACDGQICTLAWARVGRFRRFFRREAPL